MEEELQENEDGGVSSGSEASSDESSDEVDQDSHILLLKVH